MTYKQECQKVLKMNSFFERIAFWKTITKREFTATIGSKAYPITQEGFIEFQDDMYSVKAFEYEAMQQMVDSEMKNELELALEARRFLENRLQALKLLDTKFMIVRSS